jgi:N-ethylmaleimide reductase
MNHHTLFEPYQLNKLLRLKNRIIMAPMTRNMANNDFTPTQDMLNYYVRRTDAGLIVTEGTIIREDARCYNNTPGIFTQSHIDGWQKITDAVHENNGLIFLQLWHVGRVSHPTFLDGALPISPSETIMTARVRRTTDLYHGKSRAATLDEIKSLIESYAIAAENAIKAGFDGVEIHGANGYLIDQFLHYNTNSRNDNYGTIPENMARFALEIVDACGSEIGYNRVGLRLSPGAYLHEIIGDKKDAFVFEYLLKQLNNFPIAYVHTGNFDDSVKFEELNNKSMTQFMRQYYKGILTACGNYSLDTASDDIKHHRYDLIAIGRPFIANPDFIFKITNNLKLTDYDPSMLEILY